MGMKKQNMCLLQFYRSFSIFLIIGVWFVSQVANGQCFSSSGNPVGGSQSMGVLDRGVITVMGFHRYSYFDRYFEGGSRSDVDILRNADFNFSGISLAYGLNQQNSVEAELGYFLNKTKRYKMPAGYSLSGFGLSNAVLLIKRRFYQNHDINLTWTASLGAKIPFKQSLQTIDNVRLPFDLQASTCAFGGVVQSYLVKQNSFTGMRYFLYNRLDLNGTSKDGYHYGMSMINAVFISRHIIRTSSWPVSITLIAQLRNEIRRPNTLNDEIEQSSGSHKFFLSPQVNFSMHDIWNISLMTDIPVYQYYNHVQLADRISVAISVAKIIVL